MALLVQPRELPSLRDLHLPVDGYIRVSRVGDRGGESYISPDVQRRALESWATDRDVEMIVHDAEENVSGGTMDRPVFNSIMRRIRSGQSGGIVVWKLDRFARTMVGGLTTLQELAERGALFASATEPLFDFTTADGRMFMQMNLMMAEYFRERTKESWAVSLAHAVGRGVHIAPTVPYGYAKDASKRLVPDDAAQFVTEAFRKRAELRWSLQRIAEWLNDEAPPRADGRPWIDKTVERMLRRPVYTGVAHWGSERNEHAHEALVSGSLWEAAQRRVRSAPARRTGDDVALLNGIVRCAGCRFQMSRALNVTHGYSRRYYRCRVRRASGLCGTPAMIRGEGPDGLETYVEDIVKAELDRLQQSFVEVDDTDELNEALAEVEVAERDLEEMRNDTTARSRLGSAWLAFVEPYVAALEAAQARVDSLRSAGADPRRVLTVDAYEAMSRTERAGALQDMIDCVFVRHVGGRRGPHATPIDAQRVRILWRGSGPSDLPAANKLSTVVPWTWPGD